MLAKRARLHLESAAALAAPVVVLLLALGALQLVWSPGAGSLVARLGTPTALLILTWHVGLLLSTLAVAALADALPFAGRAGSLAGHPLLAVAASILVTLQIAGLIAERLVGQVLARGHLRFLLMEVGRLGFVTTARERAGLFLLPLVGAALTLVLLGLGRRSASRGQGVLRALGMLLAGTVIATAIGHAATAGNRAPIYERRAALWTTVADSYAFSLRNNGTWLTHLVLGAGGSGPIDASRPDLRRFVRTGGTRVSADDWRRAIVPAPARQRNVLLIKLDSLRWDMLQPTGGDPAVTPNLSRLAASGVLYDRCYAPSSETAYSFPAMLTSQYPLRRPYRDYHEDLAYPHTGLAPLLSPLGYRTGFFKEDDHRWQRIDRLLPREDYDFFVDALSVRGAIRGAPAGSWLRRADAEHQILARLGGASDRLFDEVAAQLLVHWVEDAPERPFFAVLDLLAPHYPYYWPPDLAVPFHPHERRGSTTFVSYPREMLEVMYNAYRNALYYSDGLIGWVLARLEQMGIAGRTIVVIAADHGQSFFEHGVVTHGRAPFEQQIRVPILILDPELAPRTVSDPVSLVDILPTILGRLGLPPHGAFQGYDLLDPGTARLRPAYFVMQSPMTNQEAVIYDRFKYVEDFDHWQARLVDLVADPGELTNLLDQAGGEPPIADRLRRDLRAWHTSQLLYYNDPDLYTTHDPPRYGALFAR